jgi:hypothetical protein
MPRPFRYLGLDWIKGKQALLGARSDTTPHLYTLHAAGEEIVAYVGFYDPQTGDAHPARIPLGRFRDLGLAQLACERHDYLYVRADAEARGQDTVFVGSDATRATAAEIERAAPGEHLADLLIDMPRSASGAPFHRVASFFEGRKETLRQGADGSWTVPLVVKAQDIPGWLRDAPKGTRLTVAAMRMAEGAPDEEALWAERHREAFTRAHLLPQDPLFQEWLGQRYDRWGLIASAETKDSDAVLLAVQETLKRLLGIPTRRDLQTNRDAVERLEAIDREFYADLSLRARQRSD